MHPIFKLNKKIISCSYDKCPKCSKKLYSSKNSLSCKDCKVYYSFLKTRDKYLDFISISINEDFYIFVQHEASFIKYKSMTERIYVDDYDFNFPLNLEKICNKFLNIKIFS